MNIYTRTGDDGQTDTGKGRRAAKDSAEMELVGTLDELNSLVGMARAERLPESLDAILGQVQSDLLVLGSEFIGAMPSRPEAAITKEKVGRLEAHIDHLDAELPRLRGFILPGGSRAGATLHVARAVCRRAERRLVTLMSQTPAITQPAACPVALAYLNRLSDLLFVLARATNAGAGVAESTWP
jgi:cob(I)alamin adenosyltransferase